MKKCKGPSAGAFLIFLKTTPRVSGFLHAVLRHLGPVLAAVGATDSLSRCCIPALASFFALPLPPVSAQLTLALVEPHTNTVCSSPCSEAAQKWLSLRSARCQSWQEAAGQGM